jgi:hypothetical protein
MVLLNRFVPLPEHRKVGFCQESSTGAYFVFRSTGIRLRSGGAIPNGPAARVSTGYRTHQREVERERVTERSAHEYYQQRRIQCGAWGEERAGAAAGT